MHLRCQESNRHARGLEPLFTPLGGGPASMRLLNASSRRKRELNPHIGAPLSAPSRTAFPRLALAGGTTILCYCVVFAGFTPACRLSYAPPDVLRRRSDREGKEVSRETLKQAHRMLLAGSIIRKKWSRQRATIPLFQLGRLTCFPSHPADISARYLFAKSFPGFPDIFMAGFLLTVPLFFRCPSACICSSKSFALLSLCRALLSLCSESSECRLGDVRNITVLSASDAPTFSASP